MSRTNWLPNATQTVLLVKVLLSVAFIAAGGVKLIGMPDMVEAYDKIGWGQWFRYATAAVEIVSVILLWVTGRQFLGAFFLTCTMVCAVLFHVFVLGQSTLPAIGLGLLSGFLMYVYRDQAKALISRT